MPEYVCVWCVYIYIYIYWQSEFLDKCRKFEKWINYSRLLFLELFLFLFLLHNSRSIIQDSHFCFHCYFQFIISDLIFKPFSLLSVINWSHCYWKIVSQQKTVNLLSVSFGWDQLTVQAVCFSPYTIIWIGSIMLYVVLVVNVQCSYYKNT